MALTPIQLLLFLLIAYLLGAATPILLLRGLAIDETDSCFLSTILIGIIATILIFTMLVFFR
jgi:hypothetical protein